MNDRSDAFLHRPILIVEDNPFDLDLALRAFRRCNLAYPIEVARDGEEATQWLKRWDAGEIPPRVILLDLKLPRVDGLEVLRRLKRHRRFRTVPVVVLTTSTEECDIRSALELGANSYIVKPVDFGQFAQVLAEIESYWCRLNRFPG